MDTQNRDYQNGFVPYAVAAAALSLCGGLTAAVPSNIVADWGLRETSVTWLALAYSLGAASMAPVMGKLVDILSPNASDADFGLAMSGIKPSEHQEKGDGAK